MTRIVYILTLILAGETIFGLPFGTARFFRPTFLEVFGYFPGGVIADRFSARALMTVSLFATAVGGLYMAVFPGGLQMALLYGYWGITTIFLFWAAMIRATREWGGEYSQGRAFGILDGGRGLVAAAVAVVAVAVLSLYMPEAADLASDAERREGLRAVILFYSAVTFGAGVLTWFLLPRSTARAAGSFSNPLAGMATVIRRPIVWAQAAVIVCAYCAYKGLDNYSLYAVQVLGMDEVEGARFTAYAAYIRPVAAVAAGFISDRFSAAKTIGVTFLILTASYIVLAVAAPTPSWLPIIYANIFVSFFAVFGLRGVYFALLQESGTPAHLTGTTVGVVSFVGYTPEILIAFVGLLVVVWLLWLKRRPAEG